MAEQSDYEQEFNDWAALADADPNAFERMRQSLIDEFIESAPEERREHLRCLQWRIDQERARARSPLGACIRITRMMWDRVNARGGLVDQLQRLRGCLESGPQRKAPRAPVLEFRRRQD